MRTHKNSNLVVIAGGYDLEMLTIINICKEKGIEIVDKTLGWGESSAVHAEAVARAQTAGKTVVFIEPIFDANFPQPEESIVIDHHGERAQEAPSILQFLELIGEEPNREQQLIGANDAGYIPAMMALGASPEEIAAIRLADRQAQGISQEQEAEAEHAIAAAEEKNGVTIVRMSHSKCATVTDRLFNPNKPQNLLILSEDGEINYYSATHPDFCPILEAEMKELGASYTFKGATFAGGNPNQAEVEKFVTDYFRN